VDTVINDAINLRLVQLDNEQCKGHPGSERPPQVETLQKENRVLKQVIAALRQQRPARRKRRKDADVSPLQLYGPDFFSPTVSDEDVTPKAFRLRQSLRRYDEIDLMAMIYDLIKRTISKKPPSLRQENLRVEIQEPDGRRVPLPLTRSL
jgi:hypothetical protein